MSNCKCWNIMIKEQIESGDILTTDDGIIAHVKKIIPSGVSVYINNQKDIIYNNQLHHWHRANPIKDNRIVNDCTFAIRFRQFLNWIPKEWWRSQPHYYEEYEYMQKVANRLVKYQIETVTDLDELKYLMRVT